MQKKLILTVALFFIAVVISGALIPIQTSYAVYLQDMPNLDGTKIYFTEANREASRFDRTPSGLSRFAGLLVAQGAETATLEWQDDFPTDADMVVVAGPLDELSGNQVSRLWVYVRDGGNALVLADGLGIAFDGTVFGSARVFTQGRGGFFDVYGPEYGVRPQEGVVGIDAPLARSLQGDESGEIPPADEDAPPILVNFSTSNVNEDHPIMAGLEGPFGFSGARPITIDGSAPGVNAVPLIFSNSNFYAEVDYDDTINDGIAEYNVGRDVSRGPLPLAAAVEIEATGGRMVLIGDRDIATNGSGLLTAPAYTAALVFPENARFLLQASAWALGREDAIEAVGDVSFPTPGATATPTAVPTLVPDDGQ